MPMPQSALRQFTPQSAEPAVRSYNPFNPAFRETMRSGITDLLGGRAMGGTPSQRYRAGMADMLTGAVDFVPGVGEAVGVADTVQAARGGNYGTAAILGGATALGMLPVVGDAASKAVRNALPFVPAAPAIKTTRGSLNIGSDIKNMGSIPASLENYEIVDGLQMLPINAFETTKAEDLFYAKNDRDRVRKLSEQIEANKRIDPLIVVQDAEGYYVLEGGHRLGALDAIGAENVPAIIVKDLDYPYMAPAAPSPLEGTLDMSQAARVQRAAEQGKTVDVYHGTNADYSSFDPERLDIGLHVGTPEQAANRLRDTANPLIGGRSSYYATGANILPLKANLGNSLVMPDVGDWGDSLQVLEELKNVKGFDKSQIQALIDDAEQAMSISSLKGVTWTETPENKSFLNEIKEIISGRGYDSIKYQNAVENDYYDLADITDEAKNIKRELGYGLDYFERKVRGRMPRIPEVNDPDVAERMQEYLGAKFDDYILPEEAQAMDSLKAQMRAVDSDPKYLKDTSSYIILDPARNVSSRFAAFDPSKRGSGNIMAGAAGAAVGLSALRGLQSDEQERKPD